MQQFQSPLQILIVVAIIIQAAMGLNMMVAEQPENATFRVYFTTLVPAFTMIVILAALLYLVSMS